MQKNHKRLAVSFRFGAAITFLSTMPCAVVPAFAQQSSVVAAVPSFTNVVLQNFDTWDKNHDGVLSASELDALVNDPHVTDEAAAAAATLKMMVRGGKFIIPPMTRAYFASYSAYASTYTRAQVVGEASKDDTTVSASTDAAPGTIKNPSTAFPGYGVAYRSALRRIKLTQPDCFVGDAPSLPAVKQGHIGDCFFLAVVGGYLHRDPANVKKMIATNSDGSYVVTFPSGKKAHVAAITDGDVALGSGSTGTGRWVSVLEAAYGSLRTTTSAVDGDVMVDTDSIAKGGSIRTAMRTLTGHNTERMALRKPNVMPMPEESEVAPKLPAIRAAIAAAVKENHLIAAGTSEADRPAGITPRHAYAIIGYDAAADTITLWNPHGQTFTPKGEPGLTNGYPTKGGVFTVPVVEFARIFSGMTWELDQIAPTLPLPSTLPPARSRAAKPANLLIPAP